MNKIAKIFTVRDNHMYIDDIQNIVDKYNNTYHSSIKMTTVEASNEGIVYYDLYNKRHREMLKRSNKSKYKTGDIVRIHRFKKLFEKGYAKKWTDEIFTIYKVNNSIPVTYKIKTYEKKNGHYEYIKGNFYEQELQITKMA